jgi:hypothetical protein
MTKATGRPHCPTAAQPLSQPLSQPATVPLSGRSLSQSPFPGVVQLLRPGSGPEKTLNAAA